MVHMVQMKKKESYLLPLQKTDIIMYFVCQDALPNSRTMIFHWQFSAFYKIHLPQHISVGNIPGPYVSRKPLPTIPRYKFQA